MVTQQCCGSWMFIPDPNFFNHGSLIRIKEFKYLTQKWFLNSRTMIRVFIPNPDPDILPIPDPGAKKTPDPESRIRIQNTVTQEKMDFHKSIFMQYTPRNK
jgi:hypothetical protein